jgi:hypothetical protein
MRFIKYFKKAIDLYIDLGFYGFLLHANQYLKIKYNLNLFDINPRGCDYADWIRRYDRLTPRHEALLLPEGFDYFEVHGLSIEVQQKLSAHRPQTLGQASRISGVTPAALSLLRVHLKKRGLLSHDNESAGPRAA